MALEIWEEDEAKAVAAVAEAEGVVTTNITTINSTTINSNSTEAEVNTVTAAAWPIRLEPHHLPTQTRMSSRHNRSHNNRQQLTNSLQALACLMARTGSPWAEGSRNHQCPACPLLNLNLEFESHKLGDEKHGLLFAMLIDMVRDLPFRSLSLEVGFLIDGPYNAFCMCCVYFKNLRSTGLRLVRVRPL